MPSKKRAGNKKKGSQSNFAKLSIFQPNKYKFKKSCPLSVKGAPVVDYKNIRLLKKYISENALIPLFCISWIASLVCSYTKPAFTFSASNGHITSCNHLSSGRSSATHLKATIAAWVWVFIRGILNMFFIFS